MIGEIDLEYEQGKARNPAINMALFRNEVKEKSNGTLVKRSIYDKKTIIDIVNHTENLHEYELELIDEDEDKKEIPLQ